MFLQMTAIGRLGKDPERRSASNGEMSSFTLATSQWRQGAETTTWLNVTIFGKLAETANRHLKKGDLVFLQGDGSLREFGRRDGTTGQSLDLTVGFSGSFKMLGGSKHSDSGGGDRGSGRPQQESSGGAGRFDDDLDDDVPF